MTGVAYGAGNAYPSGAPDFTSGFHRGSCCPVIYVSLFHVIVFVFWIFSFDCSFCLIAWCLYFFTFVQIHNSTCITIGTQHDIVRIAQNPMEWTRSEDSSFMILVPLMAIS